MCNFINQYVKNWEDSEEIIQSTFLNIWKGRDRIDVKGGAKSYLFQAAKNNMIDYLRKRKSTHEIDEGLIESVESLDSSSLDPLVIKEVILKIASGLKEKNREIFILNKLEGLTYEEIANHLNISKRSVEDNISRAMKHMKQEIEHYKYLLK